MLQLFSLARRVEHSLEMLCWIRLQVEIPVILSGIFYSVGIKQTERGAWLEKWTRQEILQTAVF